MNTLFVWYPKCSTCRKARMWLVENGISFVERHIVSDSPTAEELRMWIAASGLPARSFFNTAGVHYRELGLKDKLSTMSDEEMISLLAENGMLIKRPLLISEGKILVGFKEDKWSTLKNIWVDYNKLYAIKFADEKEASDFAIMANPDYQGFNGICYCSPPSRGHMIKGHLGRKTAAGFTFISEGYARGEWEFIEVTYENFRDIYCRICLDGGRSALKSAHNTQELIDFFKNLKNE